MRITIDQDSRSLMSLAWKMFKGIIGIWMVAREFRLLPDEIELSATKKGYHLIWYDLKISEKQMFLLRKFIGDDPNRLWLDMCSPKRIKQVLFTSKRIIYYKKRGGDENKGK